MARRCPKSSVWKYFVRADNNGATCNICFKFVKGATNTSNYHKHLETNHKLFLRKPTNNQLQDNGVTTLQNSLPVHSSSNSATACVDLTSEEPKTSDAASLASSTPSTPTSASSMRSSIQPKLRNVIENQLSFAGKKYFCMRITVSSTIHLLHFPCNNLHLPVFFLFTAGGSSDTAINNLLVYLVTKERLPYRFVESQGLRKLLKKLAPRYHAVDKKTFTQLVDHKYSQYSSQIKAKLACAENLALTFDFWLDSLNTQSYLGVTAHFIDRKEFESITIGVTETNDRHTAENISSWLLELLAKWNINIENIAVVVTDNASNVSSAAKNVFGSDRHLGCFAHILNLIVTKSVEKCTVANEIIKKVKSIVNHFKHSVNDMDKLKKASDLKLIQSVETRWNSTYYMLDRFIKLKDVVSVILMQNKDGPEMLSARELHALSEILIVLKPFEVATKIVSGEKYLTGSKIIPIIQIIRNKLQSLQLSSPSAISLKNKIKFEFECRSFSIEKNVSLTVATLLDPRYKQLHCKNDETLEAAKTLIRNELNFHDTILNCSIESSGVNNLQNPEDLPDDENDFWGVHEDMASRNSKNDSYNSSHQFETYLKEGVINIKKCPIEYWQCKDSINNALSKLALKYLSIIATSVPSERLFSATGQIITVKRNRLDPKHVQNLLFLYSLDDKYWDTL